MQIMNDSIIANNRRIVIAGENTQMERYIQSLPFERGLCSHVPTNRHYRKRILSIFH